ncbi:BRO-N domain-containing protein [Streptacidiphilus pinicola]|nr:Bro-N domain-containing protein [Streptacidiphilus pinicola]
MLHAEFPATGQPIRVILLENEPWFATMDVCRILGRGNPSMAVKNLHSDETRTVDMRTVCLSQSEAYDETAGRNAYGRGNQTLNLVNESGLYKLVLRSDKPTARPFQDWVTRELLPSIRRGDADLGAARERMAETFAEALNLEPPEVGPRRLDVDDQPFEVRNDGSVHCPHGRMRLIAPVTEDELEPPFGPYLLCSEVERVGIRRHKGHRPCQRLLVTSVVRHLRHQSKPPLPEADVVVQLGSAQLRGKPAHIAEVLHRLGMTAPGY